MNCPNCGAPIYSNKCQYCGHTIDGFVPISNAQKSKNSPYIIEACYKLHYDEYFHAKQSGNQEHMYDCVKKRLESEILNYISSILEKKMIIYEEYDYKEMITTYHCLFDVSELFGNIVDKNR